MCVYKRTYWKNIVSCSISAIAIQVHHDNSQVEHDQSDKGFTQEIETINTELEKFGFDRVHSGEEIGEYDRKCDCFNKRLNESIVLLNALCYDGDKVRKEEILKIARRCCTMIKENNDDFYKLQDGWKTMNERLKSNNTALESLFVPRGFKRRNFMSNSLYFLLETENVENLDSLWEEYRDGRLTTEFQQKLFSGRISTLQVIITEENYTQYRNILGRHITFFTILIFSNINFLKRL